MASTAVAPGGRLARFFDFKSWSRGSVDADMGVADAPPAEVKADARLPRLNGVDAEFFSDDGGSTFRSLIGSTSIAFAAYWYVATRWRAQKIAEAPLMVVKEDQKSGSENWIPRHPLAALLDSPSLDYDMGELLERTSRYIDDGAAALWVIDRDRGGRPARLTPFRRSEFTVSAANGRLYGIFKVKTANGEQYFDAEDVLYFRDSNDGWGDGKSRFDIACEWLKLGEQARETVRDLLSNSVWPSIVIAPDKDWNPDQLEIDRFKQEIKNYGRSGKRGEPFVALSGASVESVSAKLRDLVPTDVLNRVESIVAAVSGVPAIVLQFQVGMENSPWSQMAQARRMGYEDTVVPMWSKFERVLTRQLLRPLDEDTTHFIRFDRSKIASLQIDKQQAATTASLMGTQASLNERRVLMGLEPLDDPKADEVPELTAPAAPTIDPSADNADPGTKARRSSVSVIHAAFRNESKSAWQSQSALLLQNDAHAIERLIKAAGSTKATSVTRTIIDTALIAIDAYLRAEVQSSNGKWGPIVLELLTKGAERATAVIAADLGIGYSQLHPFVVDFAQREAGELIKGIAQTTRDDVADAMARGLKDNLSVDELARMVADAGAFAPSRALLIAQTESTRASNGGPTQALAGYGKSSNRVFTKMWRGKLDGKEREAHIEMEGEVAYVDRPFSNGLQFPSEPNCRCELVFNEVIDA